MKYLFPLFLAAVFYSCSSSELATDLSDADTLSVVFFNNKGQTSHKIVETTDRNAIRKLAHYVDEKKADSLDCGADGYLLFRKGTTNTKVEFGLDDCRIFAFEYKDSIQIRKMTDEAYDFLQALKAGRSVF